MAREAGGGEIGEGVDLRLRLILREAHVELVDVERERILRELGTRGERLVDGVAQRHDCGEVSGGSRGSGRRSTSGRRGRGASGVFRLFSAAVSACCGEEEVLLEGGDLRLRGGHVDGRERALLGLAAVALVLLLGEADGLGLHLVVAPGEVELPVGLDGQRDALDDALPELLRW